LLILATSIFLVSLAISS